MVDERKDVGRFRLNPKDFPTRIDLEVPEEVLAYLQRISDRTGRSITRSLPPWLPRAQKSSIQKSLIYKQKY
jgi:hypothetical protein